jgi:hypothetical protein
MRWACKAAIVAFVLLYLAALALLAIGTFGLFGADRAPLSGVVVLVLGMPWNRLVGGSLPEAVLPWFAVAAPAVNLALLALLCRLFRRAAA